MGTHHGNPIHERPPRHTGGAFCRTPPPAQPQVSHTHRERAKPQISDLRPRLFKLALYTRPEPIMWVIDCMRLDAFEMDVRVAEPLFTEKQLRQAVINPKQEIVKTERGRDPEGCLVT